MFLAVDIGNSDIVVGVFSQTNLKEVFRFSSQNHWTVDEAGLAVTDALERTHVANEEIDKVAIASVVPSLTCVFAETARKYLGCMAHIVSHASKLPVTIDIDEPHTIGADRIANASAAFDKFGGPVIAVDIGTATTFDVVTEDGGFIGGVIIPGPMTGFNGMLGRTAQLHMVPFERPPRVVGKSTREALQAGLYYGSLGQIDSILERIIEETSVGNFRIVATGGLSGGIHEMSRYIKFVEPTLTLEGLHLIGEMN